ncbi:MAG: DUF2382 domain-containing protein [Methylotenera sp.]|nr:DUF2382 domain-containing protein [Oligoflexia bacterium]
MLNKNDFMNKFSNVHEGMTVITQDGEKLGKIVALDSDSFTVEKGFFFPKDFTARYDDISSADDDQLILGRQTTELGDWKNESYAGWNDIDQYNDQYQGLYSQDLGAVGITRPGIFGIGATGNLMDNRDGLHDPRKDIRAQKTLRQTGEVELRKVVHTEHKTINVPVMKEEVHLRKETRIEQETLAGDVRSEDIEIDRQKRKAG